VLVLQEQSEKEAGLGEDAAALFRYSIAGLLSVFLQQVQQRLHGAFHRIHRLDGLVVLRGDILSEWSRGTEREQEGTDVALNPFHHLMRQRKTSLLRQEKESGVAGCK